jgi:hypothetical protein
MIETTQACARGCSILRRHLVECPDPKCRGCLPRRAERGRLCQTCHRRFELMLTDAPTVYRWLTGNMVAGQEASRAKEDHERRRGGGERGITETPVPIKLAVMDVRDLLADQLTEWVDEWCELKSLTGPLRHTVDADVAFLLTWLYGLESVEWIADWWESLAQTMSDAHALAPWRPVMRRVPGVPCPGCAETNLVIFGGETDITCMSCKIMLTEQRFELWERVLKMGQEEAS